MYEELEPLRITCTSTDCEDGLHCFLATRKMKLADQSGRCRTCGIELIDWDRVHSRNLSDIDFTFESLRKELIRHYFWHIEINDYAVNYAKRKGTIELRKAIENRIRKSVGPAQPYRDGIQTPREGSRNPIHFAQHATASCCRKCIEEWHGIPRGRELTEGEIEYLSELAYLYLMEKMPYLTTDGEYVPSKRTR